MQKRYEPMIRSLPPAAIDHLRTTFNLPPTTTLYDALATHHLCQADVVMALLDTPHEDAVLPALGVTRVECMPHVPAPHRPPPPDTRPRVTRVSTPPWRGSRLQRWKAARPRVGMLRDTLLARGLTRRDVHSAICVDALEIA